MLGMMERSRLQEGDVRSQTRGTVGRQKGGGKKWGVGS